MAVLWNELNTLTSDLEDITRERIEMILENAVYRSDIPLVFNSHGLVANQYDSLVHYRDYIKLFTIFMYHRANKQPKQAVGMLRTYINSLNEDYFQYGDYKLNIFEKPFMLDAAHNSINFFQSEIIECICKYIFGPHYYWNPNDKNNEYETRQLIAHINTRTHSDPPRITITKVKPK